MAEDRTHWGDEDPLDPPENDPEFDQELFESAKYLGWTPEDLRDEKFAARYKNWLEQQK